MLYIQNRKLGNLRKCSFTSNFDSSCIFPKFAFSTERVKACVFLWLLILNHIFPENFMKVPQVVQKIWRFSRSILIFSSIFRVFWHFFVNKEVVVTKEVLQPPCCYREINDVVYNKWGRHFLLSTNFKQVV